ncbi:hypothetical protein [Terricaulis silvestris]|uniref:Uncharacterized protein n=1 Tax=Terricaulis silvestris TaxID=2686094 RepID=A0A6I6MUH6_9CAUL|nr:hypothetical protein [Terricaulis silvestris]QGZ97116.1 hypothetical protein DSM104635_03982 [Terricaulis silvestris]
MAFVFAAMLAVFLQAFAVQTHIHASGVLTVAAHERTAGDTDGAVHVSDADDKARICDIVTSTCHTTLTVSRALAAHTVGANEAAAVAIRLAPRAVTHSWQSRAPPIAA